MTKLSPITIARNLRHMTQGELAAKLGLTPQRVSHWETGTRNPGPDHATHIARALDVDAAWIRGTAQYAPLYDPLTHATHIGQIVRSELLPDGMMYHLYLDETGDTVAMLLIHGEQFTPRDWQSLQPQNVADAPNYVWMDVNGHDAIMLDGLPRRWPA